MGQAGEAFGIARPSVTEKSGTAHKNGVWERIPKPRFVLRGISPSGRREPPDTRTGRPILEDLIGKLEGD